MAEYEKPDNIRIIKSVCKFYAKNIPLDQLKQCGLIGLWKCLKANRSSKVKFTTSLYNHVNWECLQEIKTNKSFYTKDFDISSYHSNLYDLIDYFESIGEEKSKLLLDRYLNKSKLREIASTLHLTAEGARARIKIALEEFKTKYETEFGNQFGNQSE